MPESRSAEPFARGDFVESIRVIRKSDNDDFVPTLEPQFVVLGMIDEYAGVRQVIEDDSTVEHFFADERPIADLFAKYLTLYGARVYVDSAEVSIVEAATGHSSVESRSLNAHINALYHEVSEIDRFSWLPGGLRHGAIAATLRIEEFPRKTSMLYCASEMNPRFSYLYGAVLRFGREGLVIKMANASQKIELIKQLLEELDVEWVNHRYSVGGAPTVHEVTFGADRKLTKFLQLALLERAEAFGGAGSAD
jgi:hypothetical protein